MRIQKLLIEMVRIGTKIKIIEKDGKEIYTGSVLDMGNKLLFHDLKGRHVDAIDPDYNVLKIMLIPAKDTEKGDK